MSRYNQGNFYDCDVIIIILCNFAINIAEEKLILILIKREYLNVVQFEIAKHDNN